MLRKLRTFMRRQAADDSPVIEIAKLLLGECVRDEAQSLVFGVPPNDLPRRLLPDDSPQRENERAYASDCARFGREPELMPVWIGNGAVWRECQGIFGDLYPHVLAYLQEHSSIPWDTRPFEASHVNVGSWDGADFFVQFQLRIEDNFCYSINVLDTASRVAEETPRSVRQKDNQPAPLNGS